MQLLEELKSDWLTYRFPEQKQVGVFPLRHGGFWLLATYRFGNWAQKQYTPIISKVIKLLYVILNLFVTGFTGGVIRPNATIGRNVLIHTTQGVLITNGVTIGNGTIVNCGVCIVSRADGKGAGVATIGKNVYLGIGAKILGAVTIGDNSKIGANAVVLKDVPDNHLAIGVPATIKELKK